MKFVYDGIRMNPITDAIVGQAKEHAKSAILTFIAASFDILKDVSYTVALIGGGICIIVYAVAGVRRAGKAFGVLVLVNALIHWLL